MLLRFCLCAALALAVGLSRPSAGPAQIMPNQVDTFSAGVAGWAMGQAGTISVQMGGPGGASDPFLQATSDGSANLGRLTFFNRTQWLGNYNTAGITAIEMDLRNLSGTALAIRIAIKDTPSAPGGGSGYASTAFNLPANSPWTRAVFPLTPAAMSPVGTTQPLNAVLSAPVEFRILHSTIPSVTGDFVTAQIGVDNIRAVPEPTGLLALLLGATGLVGTRALRRRRHG
jgi:hypothetical protein